MKENSEEMKAITTFVTSAYGLSVVLSLFIGLTGGHESPFIGLAYLSMFLPATSVLIVTFAMNEPARVRWNHFPLRYLPLALFLIPGVLHAAMLPAMAAIQGGLRWQDWLRPQPDGLYHTPAARGWGTVTIEGLVGHIAVNALAGLVVVSFLAFFKEVGWRAWLLPRLANGMEFPARGSGHCDHWALWHVPFELAGILHIDGVPQ
ncbi:MAG TPA: hypothetical protein VE621_10465 [Bryobacteraceae bacterium]|nr:hypothetical protein [Bryobacteraceae bacterium]